MSGGAGADTYYYAALDDAADTIGFSTAGPRAAFESGVDKIQISENAVAFAAGTPIVAGSNFEKVSESGSQCFDGNEGAIQDPRFVLYHQQTLGTYELYYDDDGKDGVEGETYIADMDGVEIHAHDIEIVEPMGGTRIRSAMFSQAFHRFCAVLVVFQTEVVSADSWSALWSLMSLDFIGQVGQESNNRKNSVYSDERHYLEMR